MQRSAGFTLIELVVVIVILALLAVVAIPKFIDLSASASTAAVTGVAGQLSSGSVINYSARKANASNGVAVANCSNVSSTLGTGLPTGYSITAAAVSVDSTVSCVLNGPNSTTATFIAIGIN